MAGLVPAINVFERYLEHDPEKWVPVFRKDHAPSKCESGNRFKI
jgi:hypothetical protein